MSCHWLASQPSPPWISRFPALSLIFSGGHRRALMPVTGQSPFRKGRAAMRQERLRPKRPPAGAGHPAAGIPRSDSGDGPLRAAPRVAAGHARLQLQRSQDRAVAHGAQGRCNRPSGYGGERSSELSGCRCRRALAQGTYGRRGNRSRLHHGERRSGRQPGDQGTAPGRHPSGTNPPWHCARPRHDVASCAYFSGLERAPEAWNGGTALDLS